MIAVVWACLLLSVHAAPLAAPPEITPVGGVTTATLVVRAARVVVEGAVTFTTRAYHVSGSATPQFPGPTLRLTPGGTLRLTLKNELGPESAATSSAKMNQLHMVNTTNVHTHGLHVDPKIDSIFRKAEPGQTLEYELPIPASHAPGVHWYHSHSHGSSAMQIMGGLLGGIIVDDVPAGLKAIPEVIVVVHHLKFESANTQNCGNQFPIFDPFKVYSVDEMAAEGKSDLVADPVFANPAIKEFLLVNGQYQPSLSMRPNEQKRLRIVIATGAETPYLEFEGPPVCTMAVIAFDGVYITGPPRVLTTVRMVPGQRVEIIVSCNAVGTYNLLSNHRLGTYPKVTLMVFAITGTAAVPTAVGNLDAITVRPAYLRDLRDAPAARSFDYHFSQGGKSGDVQTGCNYWLGEGSNCAAGLASSSCRFRPFLGSRGLDAKALDDGAHVGTVGDIETIRIFGLGNEPHPVHIHVNHFQIISYVKNTNGQPLTDWMEVGDWRDTVPALDGLLTVRTVLDTFSGEVVLHCHMLMHEDRGLMTTFLIEPAVAAPAAPSSTTASLTPTPVGPTTAPPTTAAPSSPGASLTFGPTAPPGVATAVPTAKSTGMRSAVIPSLRAVFLSLALFFSF